MIKSVSDSDDGPYVSRATGGECKGRQRFSELCEGRGACQFINLFLSLTHILTHEHCTYVVLAPIVQINNVVAHCVTF